MLGSGAKANDMLYLDCGTGIGLGVITEGRLLRGSRECAAEFGHTHVMQDGPACKCGSFGCLEALAGGPALAAQARKAIQQGGTSKVTELAGGKPITGMDVMEAARHGDKLCATLVEGVKRVLGLGLANIVNLFNPSLVVIDRRLGAADPGFLEDLSRAVRNGALEYSTQALTFRYSQLGEEAGVLGVALLALERFFEIPVLHAPKFMTDSAAMSAGQH
jgi:predicted NBD/HSP70 family sugar kinase